MKAPETVFDNGEVRLSRRELQVLSMLAKGYLAKQMADVLGVKVGSVNYYKLTLYRALGVHTAAEAVFEAFQLGIFKDILKEYK